MPLANHSETDESRAVESEELGCVELESVEQKDFIIHLAFADDSVLFDCSPGVSAPEQRKKRRISN